MSYGIKILEVSNGVLIIAFGHTKNSWEITLNKETSISSTMDFNNFFKKNYAGRTLWASEIDEPTRMMMNLPKADVRVDGPTGVVDVPAHILSGSNTLGDNIPDNVKQHLKTYQEDDDFDLAPPMESSSVKGVDFSTKPSSVSIEDEEVPTMTSVVEDLEKKPIKEEQEAFPSTQFDFMVQKRIIELLGAAENHEEEVVDTSLDLLWVLIHKGRKYGNTILEKDVSKIFQCLENKFDRINTVMSKGEAKDVRKDDWFDFAGYISLLFTHLRMHNEELYREILKSALKD